MNICAYTHRFSYFSNENINLRINSLSKNVNINIINFKNNKTIINYQINGNFKQKDNNEVELLFVNGYKWKINHVIKFPKNIEHGLYFIELKTIKNSFYIPFIIKSDKKTDFVVLMNTNTWHAYDSTGGASFYRYNIPFNTKYGSTNSKFPIISAVTFDRPLNFISNNISFYIKNGIINKYDHLLYGELRLLKWLYNNKYDVSIIDDNDIDLNYPLKNHKTLVLNCHPEYWTQNMINNIYYNANNIVSIAGNVGYRKIVKNGLIIKRIGLWDKKYLDKITGSYYDDIGYDTNSYYKIHRGSVIFNGVNGKIFGEKTLNKNPKNDDGISGYETDKMIVSNIKKNIIGKRTK